MIAFLLMDGVVRGVFAFKIKPLSGWGMQLISGIASIVLAVLIWRDWPLSGLWAIGTLLGIRMLFAGFGMLALPSIVEEETAQTTA